MEESHIFLRESLDSNGKLSTYVTKYEMIHEFDCQQFFVYNQVFSNYRFESIVTLFFFFCNV